MPSSGIPGGGMSTQTPMKKFSFLLVALAAVLGACNSEPTGTPEKDQAEVKAANAAAVDSPTSGAVNPDAASEKGP
ncbi:MAG: hypothetical protein SFX74_11115 [Fimbriimonadaceae bacterium]|nr:hypothetical protein [Fimbriimonadaceae bacterium]